MASRQMHEATPSKHLREKKQTNSLVVFAVGPWYHLPTRPQAHQEWLQSLCTSPSKFLVHKLVMKAEQDRRNSVKKKKKKPWRKKKKSIRSIPCSFKRLMVGLPAEREWTFLHTKERPGIRKFSKTHVYIYVVFFNKHEPTAGWEESNLYYTFNLEKKNLEIYR